MKAKNKLELAGPTAWWIEGSFSHLQAMAVHPCGQDLWQFHCYPLAFSLREDPSRYCQRLEMHSMLGATREAKYTSRTKHALDEFWLACPFDVSLEKALPYKEQSMALATKVHRSRTNPFV